MKETSSRPTVCLNMIVRNEAPTIRRCLASVRPVVDSWTIVDTGSTDGTQEIVRDVLKDLPGELVERPWINFGHNRTEAFELAQGRATYVLVIDADEVLEIGSEFHDTELTADAYTIEVRYDSTVYRRTNVLRSSLPWQFIGVLHEFPQCEAPHTKGILTGLRVLVFHEGARARDPKTYRRDAILLETALLEEPNNARYVFYLAQSYRDAGDLQLAVRNYRRRIEMGGWSEEVWFSAYQIACLSERMGHPWGDVLQQYLAALELQPTRAEPLYRIGAQYQRAGEHHLARLFLGEGIRITQPSTESLFVERDVYQYQLPIAYALSCAHAANHEEAIAICNRILRARAVPPEHIERVVRVRRRSLDARLPSPSKVGASPHIRVCVPFGNAGSILDDCVESLLLQDDAAFDVFFIDDGSRSDQALRIPDDDPRFHVVRHDTSVGFDACIDRFVAEWCVSGDVVVALDHGSHFSARDGIRRIRSAFADEECDLLYGQHRAASCSLGDAEPPTNAADLRERGAALVSRSVVSFRARCWEAGRAPTAAALSPVASNAFDGQVLGRSRIDALMEAAGFAHTRFIDHVLTTVGPLSATLTKHVTAPAIRTAANELPSVSCLMVTHDRVALAKRSIQCYAAQTYASRELVIVCDGVARVRRSLERFIEETGLQHVRFVYPNEEGSSLGRLRNIAMDAAAGDLLCQWDDDDCYHPDRIRIQVEQMLQEGGRACCLTDHLQFLEEDRALVWVDWTLGGKSGRHQLLPGTIVMFKDDRFRYPESGALAHRGEDSMLLYQLCDNVRVVAVKGLGHLYLYNYHGRNTFDRDHHYRLSTFSRSVADLTRDRAVIRDAMAHYAVPKPYTAIGRDGPAFVLDD